MAGTAQNQFVHLKVSKTLADQTCVVARRPRSTPRADAHRCPACLFARCRSVAVTANTILLEDGVGLSFNATVARPLTKQLGGYISYDLGGQSILGVGVTHGTERHQVRTGLQLSPDNVGIETNASYQLDENVKLKGKASASTQGVSVAVGVQRSLSDISRITAFLEVGSRSGVVVRFRCAREHGNASRSRQAALTEEAGWDHTGTRALANRSSCRSCSTRSRPSGLWSSA